MSDLCDRCGTKRDQTFRRVVLALNAGCKIVRCPEEDCFSLWCLDPDKLVSLRKTILNSTTEVVSFPGADALSCLFGTGEEERVVKSGMRFIPPAWFRERREWGRHAREGLCYPAYFAAAVR